MHSSTIASHSFDASGTSRWIADFRSSCGHFLLALLLLFGGLWSHVASAQALDGCDLRAVAPASQSGAPGSTLNYKFDAVDLGTCTSDGTNGDIIILSDTTGGATVTPTGYSSSGPQQFNFSVTLGPNPGSVDIEILCTFACGPSGQLDYTATATSASGCNLQAVAPTAQSGAPGSALVYNFDVVDLGGCRSSGVSGAIAITSDTTGGATVTPGGFSGIDGRYPFSLTLGPNPGNVSLGIHCDIPCSPTATLTYTATATGAGSPAMSVSKALTGKTDPDSSDTVTPGDVLTYQVTASNTGAVPLTNVQVNDALTTPDTATCSSVAVSGTCVLTGTYTVTAADASRGSITNTGNATSTQVPGPVNSAALVTPVLATTVGPATLTLVSGNNQSVVLPTPSAPLVVELRSGGTGNPVPGATINWSTNNGTLASATTITDSSGRSSNTATLEVAGAASVTASSSSPAAGPISFSLNGSNGRITDLNGLTPEQRAVAVALDNACPALAARSTRTSAEDDLLRRCEELEQAASSNPSQVGNALNALFAGSAFLQSTAALQISATQFDNIKARIAALRSGAGGRHFGGLALNTPSGAFPLGSTFDALLGATEQKKPEVGTDFDRWGFFASGTLGHGSADPSHVLPGYNFDTGGLTAGVDYRYSNSWIFGASAGYARFNSDLDANRGHMNTRGWSLSAYSTVFHQDSWYVDSVLSWGHNSYDIDRRILYTVTTPFRTTSIDTRATANSSGSNLAGSLTVGRDFQKGGWSIGPYLRGNLARLSFDDYRESLPAGTPGSGLGLLVKSRDVQSASSVLGGKFTYASSRSWGVLMPHIQVEWEHEFKSDPYRLEAHFLNDPTATPILVHGDPLDSDFFRLGLGLSFILTGGKSGFVYYEKTLGREGITQDNLALGIRLEF